MSQNTLEFTNIECKKGAHDSCSGSWFGLGFEFYCECVCHERKYVADGYREPDSAASSQFSLEETKDHDY